MNNTRSLFVLGILAIAAVGWWMKTSHRETHSQDFSTWSAQAANDETAYRAAASTKAPEKAASIPTASASGIPHTPFKRTNLDDRVAALKGPSTSTTETFKGLPKAAEREINSHRFQPLGAFAVPNDSYQASMGAPLMEQNGYKILPLDVGNDPGWKDLTTMSEGRPVVMNPNNGSIAIVTGTLIVKLKDMEKVSAISDAENLKVLSVDDALRTVYFKAPAGYPLLTGLQRLQSRADVERAELELYQTRKGAK